jgi:succinyl-CoA synthetase alpha subunit
VAFLVDEHTRVMIQGATGKLGQLGVQMMRAAGTEPVAGVTPGRGGSDVAGVPVFDSVAQAAAERSATASILFVPGSVLRDAALEAIAGGMDPIVLMVDGVPINTALDVVHAARIAGVTLIGPNSPGVISPGRCLLGALDVRFYRPGNVAVISRSGGMLTTIANALTGAGIGQSTCVGIGGDAILGFDLIDAVQRAEADPSTSSIVVYGEVGTRQEHRLAEYLGGTPSKPVFAYVAGARAARGVRYSHAGAKLDTEWGSADAKRDALRAGGVDVADTYLELIDRVRKGGA